MKLVRPREMGIVSQVAGHAEEGIFGPNGGRLSQELDGQELRDVERNRLKAKLRQFPRESSEGGQLNLNLK